MSHPNRHRFPKIEIRWPGLVIWLTAWVLLWLCDGVLNLGNLALLLVLASAMAGTWLSATASVVLSALSVLGFNWWFVPPRFTFHVHLHQDLLLLVTMLGVSVMVSYLMARLRSAAEQESQHAQAAQQLRALSEQFREGLDLSAQGRLLQSVLQTRVHDTVSVLLLREPDAPSTRPAASHLTGHPDAQDTQGLWACVKQFAAIGPGTGRYENQATLFLPLRGPSCAWGAVALHGVSWLALTALTRHTVQQMCDVLGLELERAHTLQQAQHAKEEAQSQSLRNTLLTSISHDYRTPLANLMGAASVIHDQGARLSPEQITNLAHTVMLEAQHLNRMTTNTLQLARLDAAALQVHKDWESLQEVVGAVLSKTRMRYPLRQIDVVLPAGLPLIFCDAMLLVQLLDNLVENAIKYSPDDSFIQLHAQGQGDTIELRVIDHGPGIPDVWKSKVFQAFERMHPEAAQADASDETQLRRGVGVGLAVCQAIAKVHGAKIWIEDTRPHGATVCVAWPVDVQPDMNSPSSEV
ncbi:ATP-binding protein [Limnohabitans sp.]|uniref:sensor histidine kinase n=1 Tax=Limnohabitans sp. TaxID=1907725 RepID=UPI0038BC986C